MERVNMTSTNSTKSRASVKGSGTWTCVIVTCFQNRADLFKLLAHFLAIRNGWLGLSLSGQAYEQETTKPQFRFIHLSAAQTPCPFHTRSVATGGLTEELLASILDPLEEQDEVGIMFYLQQQHASERG
eukprot:2413389-Amphidinium_carterae.1